MWARDLEKWWRVNRLQSYLWERFLRESSEYGVVYNLGIDWDTSSWVLKRFDREAETRQPNVIIFAIGSNDCTTIIKNNTTSVLPETFKENLAALKKKANKFTDKIIFVWQILCDETKTIPIPWIPEMAQDMKNTIIYDNIIKTFCEQNNILYINMLDVIDNQDLEDGMHPTAQGHEKMYLRIKDFLLDNHII